MTSTLEAELDLLFQRPLADLVHARDALAARLRKAGDREGAAHVKRIRRPTPVAWALNQLHFREPSLLAQAFERASELRALHARDGIEPRALWAAMEAQRRASNEAAEAALAIMKDAGLSSGQAQQRKLLASVQALVAGASAEPLGRMTRELEASGFDTMEQVGAAAAKTPAGPALGTPRDVSAPALWGASDEADQAVLARAQRELANCEARVSEARARSEALKAAERQHRDALGEVQRQVREVEQTLSALRAEAARREADLVRAARASSEADAVHTQAEAALARARAALSALRAPRNG